jgi:murein DD-endopeptidase MepM/ murein hydrolase activator NlpD
MLPDRDVCVHLPGEDEGAPDVALSQNAHRDARGRWAVYDEIPRRPDRPADYDAYRYPVPCDRNCVSSGYDLDRADDLQRRTSGSAARDRAAHGLSDRSAPQGPAAGAWGHTPLTPVVGHGAVDLPQPRGTPVVMLTLEHQLGDAEVVYVGPLFGTTVITRHTLREGGQLRDYLLLFGHLDSQGPGIRVASPVREGDTIGFVGDTGSPERVHLHLEARRLRMASGVDLGKMAPGTMVDSETSVVCDPRNVLPLKGL